MEDIHATTLKQKEDNNMSENRELFEKKQALKKEWEECFGKTMESRFTAKGIAKYWDGNTSLEEAEALLTGAAINDFICVIIDKVEGVAIIDVGEGREEATEQFQVYNKVTKEFYDNVFTSKKNADEFVVREACNSEFKFSDFKVVQVYD